MNFFNNDDFIFSHKNELSFITQYLNVFPFSFTEISKILESIKTDPDKLYKYREKSMMLIKHGITRINLSDKKFYSFSIFPIAHAGENYLLAKRRTESLNKTYSDGHITEVYNANNGYGRDDEEPYQFVAHYQNGNYTLLVENRYENGEFCSYKSLSTNNLLNIDSLPSVEEMDELSFPTEFMEKISEEKRKEIENIFKNSKKYIKIFKKS